MLIAAGTHVSFSIILIIIIIITVPLGLTYPIPVSLQYCCCQPIVNLIMSVNVICFAPRTMLLCTITFLVRQALTIKAFYHYRRVGEFDSSKYFFLLFLSYITLTKNVENFYMMVTLKSLLAGLFPDLPL